MSSSKGADRRYYYHVVFTTQLPGQPATMNGVGITRLRPLATPDDVAEVTGWIATRIVARGRDAQTGALLVSPVQPQVVLLDWKALEPPPEREEPPGLPPDVTLVRP